MSQSNDLAGSEDIILVNNETQDTFSEPSCRPKQNLNRTEKNHLVDQAKENLNPTDDHEEMQVEMPNGSVTEIPHSSVESQQQNLGNNPFATESCPTSSAGNIHDIAENGSSSLETDLNHQKEQNGEGSSTIALTDSNNTVLDASTTGANLRLYVSPSTSLLETTNVDESAMNGEQQSIVEPEDKIAEAGESGEKAKEEAMDINDAQVSLGSDIVIERPATDNQIEETADLTEKSPVASSSERKRMSPTTRASYSLSQPATNKLDSLIAKLVTSPTRATPTGNSSAEKSVNDQINVREEEELLIRETVSKILRRYAVKIDSEGRTLSRELLDERTVEENTTTRVESWPQTEKKIRRTTTKIPVQKETTQKKPNKSEVTQRRAKSLKPTSTLSNNRKRAKVILSDDETVKSKMDDKSSDSDDEKQDDEETATSNDTDNEDQVTEDVSGDEFIPPVVDSSESSLTKGSRVFARWVDGHYYPGSILNISGDKCMVEFDDGAKRSVKSTFVLSQHYLPINQSVMAQTQSGFFDRGIVKRLVKKKKSGILGYVIEKDGAEKWYPLRLISLTQEQAENLTGNTTKKEEPVNAFQGKRKRASIVNPSPHKKSKSSVGESPTNNPRTTFTPTRQTKLFNSMFFLLTGFNDIMEIRHEIEESIESHGGKVIEKMPAANRRDRVYLVSDIARRTAKFFEAKKLNIPCVNYKWIEACIEKSEIQEWETHKLVLPEKEKSSTNDDSLLDAQKQD